jgi:hypothetical protein
MTNIIPFPRRGRRLVRVERLDGEGDWAVLIGSQAFPFPSRTAALREADHVAIHIDADLIVAAPGIKGGSLSC